MWRRTKWNGPDRDSHPGRQKHNQRGSEGRMEEELYLPLVKTSSALFYPSARWWCWLVALDGVSSSLVRFTNARLTYSLARCPRGANHSKDVGVWARCQCDKKMKSTEQDGELRTDTFVRNGNKNIGTVDAVGVGDGSGDDSGGTSKRRTGPRTVERLMDFDLDSFTLKALKAEQQIIILCDCPFRPSQSNRWCSVNTFRTATRSTDSLWEYSNPVILEISQKPTWDDWFRRRLWTSSSVVWFSVIMMDWIGLGWLGLGRFGSACFVIRLITPLPNYHPILRPFLIPVEEAEHEGIPPLSHY